METRPTRLTFLDRLRRTGRRGLNVLAGFAVLGLLAFYGWTIDTMSRQSWASDFVKFYAAADLQRQGRDIYQAVPFDVLQAVPDHVQLHDPHMHPNLNPPFQVLLFLPTVLLDYRIAFWIWSIVSLALGFAAVGLLVIRLRPPGARLGPLLAWPALFIAFFPTWANVSLGQLGLLLFFLLVVAWLGLRDGNERQAGIALGLCLALKPFTGLFLLLFLLLGRWRLLAWYLAGFAAATALAVIVFGVEAHLTYVRRLGDVTWFAASWNASLMGVTTRIFGGSENIPLFPVPGLAQFLGYAAMAAGALGLYGVSRRLGDAGAARWLVGYALVLVLMLLLSPLGWIYYFPCLGIVVLTSLELTRGLAGMRPLNIALVTAWLSSSIPHLLIPSEEMSDPALILTVPMFYFATLVLLLAILVRLTVRLAAPPGRPETLATPGDPQPDAPPDLRSERR